MEFPGLKLSLTCEKGRIEISDQKCELITPQSGSRWWSNATMVPDQFMYAKQSGAVAELVDVLENGGTLISPPEEAQKTLQIMLGIMKSHHGGNVRVNL
jgi:hypothetical protein